jgi:hypothetical protein
LCGFFDAGCGVELDCGGCAIPQECGVKVANRCDLPDVCTPEGWCWEHPLPHGGRTRALYAMSSREVWMGTETGSVLLWNGERTQGTSFPTQPALRLNAIHGERNDLFVVGTQSAIFHFDGGAWLREPSPPTFSGNWLSVVTHAGRAWAGGETGVLGERQADGTWRTVNFSPPQTNDVLDVSTDGTTVYAVLGDGDIFTLPIGTSLLTRLTQGPAIPTMAATKVGPHVYLAGSQSSRFSVARFDVSNPDAGWSDLASVAGPTPKRIEVFGDDVFVVVDTSAVWRVTPGDGGATRVFNPPVNRELRSTAHTATELFIGGGFGAFVRLSADGDGGVRVIDNQTGLPERADVNDGCSFTGGVRSLVAANGNSIGERINGEWFWKNLVSFGGYQWKQCHFAALDEAWAVGDITTMPPPLMTPVAKLRGASNWVADPVDTGYHAMQWKAVTGFVNGPVYVLPVQKPGEQSVLVNATRGTQTTDWVRTQVDAGLVGLAAVASRASYPLHAVGAEHALFNATLSVVDETGTQAEWTTIAGAPFADGGGVSVAVGRRGAVAERIAGFPPALRSIDQRFDLVDVWVSAATLDEYLIANPDAGAGGVEPVVLRRKFDGGMPASELLPLIEVRGVFGADVNATSLVCVAGKNGAILRRGQR